MQEIKLQTSVTLGYEVQVSKRGEKSFKRKVLCIDDRRNDCLVLW